VTFRLPIRTGKAGHGRSALASALAAGRAAAGPWVFFGTPHFPVFLCVAYIGAPSHLLVFCVLHAQDLSVFCKHTDMPDTALRALTGPASLSKDASVSNEHLQEIAREAHVNSLFAPAGVAWVLWLDYGCGCCCWLCPAFCLVNCLPAPCVFGVLLASQVLFQLGVQQWPQRRMQSAQGEQSGGMSTWRRRWRRGGRRQLRARGGGSGG
jgi:hypothetical protein